MSIKSALSIPIAKIAQKRIKKWSLNPIEAQQRVFKKLIKTAASTAFGVDHEFNSIRSYEEFKEKVPVGDYEHLRPYIERIINGEQNVLWPGNPLYLCKTSGTTSGVKYIPITKASIKNHINAARNALLSYIAETGNAEFVNGKMIFLQGSPELDESKKVPIGRLSGIVANHVPAYLLKNRKPSYATNVINDWETKLDAVVEETVNENMTLISGIPSWIQMYYERLMIKAGKRTISEIFPNYKLFVHGGVNFEPYKKTFEQMIGKKIDSIETYPASEGFIAFQDSQTMEGLLLVLNDGIFFEFIKSDNFFEDNPSRISLKDVELGVNYVIILSTNAGLWGYNIGDTVKFTSLLPPRIVVTGRIKHFTSAFGEHVIAEEVESALAFIANRYNTEIAEFHVAPQVNPEKGLPYHEWLIEFAKEPQDIDQFLSELDKLMQQKNTYYEDLIQGNILCPLKLTKIGKDGFVNYMKSIGKLGGQNKIPRLSNDRSVSASLAKWKI